MLDSTLAARGHRIQDHHRGGVPGEGEKLLSRRDGLDIVDLRATRDDHQVGNPRRFKRRGFRPRGCIDHGEVNALRSRRGTGVPEAGRLHVADDRGVGVTTAVMPVTRGRLRVDIQDHGGLPCVGRTDGKSQGEGCLTGPAFLGEECDCLH